MQVPIGVFNKGAIIYVDYTFDDDRNKKKRRPAVVIDFDADQTKVIVLKVTTHMPRTPYDHMLLDAEIANLKDGSVVRCNNIMTIPNHFACEKHGDLSRRDMIIAETLYLQAANEYALVQVS